MFKWTEFTTDFGSIRAIGLDVGERKKAVRIVRKRFQTNKNKKLTNIERLILKKRLREWVKANGLKRSYNRKVTM